LDDRTGDGTGASLLYKPCLTGSETKLLTDGKAGVITGLCSKKASKIFSGTSYRDGSGAWLILTNPDGAEFTYALRFQFAASNNEAEYEALIADLRIATQMGVKSIQVLVEVLETKSITAKEVTAVIEEEGPTWMMELVNYLKEGTLPEDEKKARKLRLKAHHMHAGPWSVVAKAIRLGYFWPTMHKDAQDMIRKCSDYQIHRPVTRHPQQPLTPIMAPWPFYKWGIDIAGPFPEGPGKVKFLIVEMDYRRTSEEIRMGQYCMPFWYSRRNNLRQR
nr:hypothetical protein [Tanacetum cinerariifolium]